MPPARALNGGWHRGNNSTATGLVFGAPSSGAPYYKITNTLCFTAPSTTANKGGYVGAMAHCASVCGTVPVLVWSWRQRMPSSKPPPAADFV